MTRIVATEDLSPDASPKTSAPRASTSTAADPPYWNDDIEKRQTDRLFASDTLLPGRRKPAVNSFDADAAAVSAGPDGRSVLRWPRQRCSRLPIRERTHVGAVPPLDVHDLPCQVHDPDLWFADAPSDLERAKALCGGCPAQLACLTGAIGRLEPTGVWGGQILDNGEIVTHKRPRGRPRNGSAMPRRYLPQTTRGV